MLSRLLYPFFFPGGIFFALGMLVLSTNNIPQLMVPYLPLFFPLLFALTLLLGFRFQRTKVIFALCLLALSLGFSLSFPLQQKLYSALALLLPFNLSLTLCLPEKRLSNPLTAVYGSTILAQALGLFWFESLWPQKFTLLFETPLPLLLPLQHQPGSLQFCTLILALLVASFCFYRRSQPLEAAFFWTILLSAAPFFLYLDQQFTLLFFNLAGLSLLAGLLETSHGMAYRDDLTGIPGRRALNETLNRIGKNYCLAMVDIDHFKKFNDKHGHDVGDQVLKMVAGRLARIGGGGRAFRYGGEEFAIVFTNKKIDAALIALEEIRQSVALAAFTPRGKDRPKKKPQSSSTKVSASKALSVTISIGTAEASKQRQSPGLVLKAADQALYRAKQQGRNRICS